ncbi:hypothetical protein ANCCEY_05549 [Ancylostoma ceylanicum]|uniref:Reverse transcriptase domain-containing protein n=1 Tax=Ancylostoma ceylanicum TaxID=53326 RepID=A0A0D6LTF5_9BILA|nr:hypothetical protein ANCCEY_05549 [Ancylostoma ceylanicum]
MPLVMPFIDYCESFDSLEHHTVWESLLEQGVERKKCDWDDSGVNVNGRMLIHLRFADDIVLPTYTPQEAERMINLLDEVCKKVGLQLNAKKTKVMRNRFADPSAVRLGQTTLEDTDEYV